MYEIPSLPYKYGDLEPYIDEETMRVHHTKHHQTYADKVNAALAKHPDLEVKDLSALIRTADQALPEDIRAAVINNGGGYLNHSFFWEILRKPADKENLPDGTTIGAMIVDQYGDYPKFQEAFKEKALSLFGSGWTWLSLDQAGKLDIVNTANQNLLPENQTALMAIDLWEHAYYLKYQNRRNEYSDAFFSVVNWPEVDKKLKLAQTKGQKPVS